MKNALLSTSQGALRLGDTISFGKYKDREIEWIILDEKEDGSKLLLSKNILLNKEYNNEFTSVTWEICTLRNWLNNDFYKEAFSTSEQSKIQTTKVINKDNEEWRTEGGKDTEDKIFILSVEEEYKYFNSYKKRVARGLDNFSDIYWLRSPGIDTDSVAYVNSDGNIEEDGYIDCGILGVRPALWVNLSYREKEEEQTRHYSVKSLMRDIEKLQKRELLLEQKIANYESRIEELEKKIDNFQNYFDQQKSNASIGDTISFGRYNDEKIEWIILDEKEDGSKLLLSKYILFDKEYNEFSTSVTWEICTLRNWLNNDFFKESFTSSEKSKIQKKHVINKDNEMYGTAGGNDTNDNVFLLSIEEAYKYFNTDEERIARSLDDYDTWGYWLRSPGSDSYSAAFVYYGGVILEDGSAVDSDYRWVRPALWVKL